MSARCSEGHQSIGGGAMSAWVPRVCTRQLKRPCTHLVVPSASTVRVCALVTREDVDQNAGVPVVVRRALAVTSTAVAGEGDASIADGAVMLPGRSEEPERTHWEVRLCLHGEEERRERGEGHEAAELGEHAGELLDRERGALQRRTTLSWASTKSRRVHYMCISQI